MARSEAQKRADKKYVETHKGSRKKFSTEFSTTEAEQIDVILTNYNISKADLVRRATERITQGDDLTGYYDRESGRIIHPEPSDEE
jgi:hypothetical protein